MQSKAPFPSSPRLPAALVQDHTALPEPPTKLVEEHITLGPRCWFLSDHKLTCAWGCPPKQPSCSSSLCSHLPPLIPSNLGISLPSEHTCVEHSVLVDTDHTDCSICVRGQICFHLAVFANLGSCRSAVTGEKEGDRDTWPWRTEPHSTGSSATSNSSWGCQEGKRCLTSSFPLGNNRPCVPCSLLSFIIFLEQCC